VVAGLNVDNLSTGLHHEEFFIQILTIHLPVPTIIIYTTIDNTFVEFTPDGKACCCQ